MEDFARGLFSLMAIKGTVDLRCVLPRTLLTVGNSSYIECREVSCLRGLPYLGQISAHSDLLCTVWLAPWTPVHEYLPTVVSGHPQSPDRLLRRSSPASCAHKRPSDQLGLFHHVQIRYRFCFALKTRGKLILCPHQLISRVVKSFISSQLIWLL